MPMPISNVVRRALTDARLSPDEVKTLKAAVAAGEVKGPELAQLKQRHGDLFQTGAGQAPVAIAPPQAHVVYPPPVRSIGDSRAAAEVLCGTRALSQGSGAKEAVTTFQRALNTLASRLGKPEWALSGSRAEGTFGPATATAVSSFQKENGLPVTGTIDQMTALKMEEQLMKSAPPEVGGVLGATHPGPDGERIAQAARDLIAAHAADYGVPGIWKSPNPSVPGNKTPGETAIAGTKNHWKCNLFGMDALYAGGAKPAQYPGGNYPIAIEIPNYSRGPNAPLVKLGEVWPDKAGTPEEAKAKIDALLKIARPGDLIIVNHQGKGTADGGHTRVVVGNTYATTGTVDCAQASSDEALIRGESLGTFTGEEAFYLLRPAQSR